MSKNFATLKCQWRVTQDHSKWYHSIDWYGFLIMFYSNFVPWMLEQRVWHARSGQGQGQDLQGKGLTSLLSSRHDLEIQRRQRWLIETTYIRSLIRSIALHGSESGVGLLKNSDEKSFADFGMWVWRRLPRISWTERKLTHGFARRSVVKVRGAGGGAQSPCSHLSPPAIVWAPLIESIKCYFMRK